MADIVVAASIDNELTSKSFADVKRLKDDGHHILFAYYLPLVSALYTQLPTMVDRIEEWHQHAQKVLRELGDKLGIPEKDRAFYDEILGPERLFDAAREKDVSVILTSNPEELKQRFLSRLFDMIMRHKEVPVDSVEHFTKEHLPARTRVSRSVEREAREDDPSYTSVYSETTERQMRGRKTHKEEVKEEKDSEQKQQPGIK